MSLTLFKLVSTQDDSDAFNVESDKPFGKSNHSVIRFCLTWGRYVMAIPTKRTNISQSRHQKWTLHDINDNTALWRIIKNHFLKMDSVAFQLRQFMIPWNSLVQADVQRAFKCNETLY